MTTPPTITAWAIKAPDGEIIVSTIKRDEDETMRFALYNHIDMKHGYRCVRVTVREMQG